MTERVQVGGDESRAECVNIWGSYNIGGELIPYSKFELAS